MEDVIKRLVLKLFPELAGGYHLPIFGEVVGVRETPDHGDICDEFRPRYAVDVQVLDQYGKPDKAWDVLRDVILSVPVAGYEMGHFAYPENGVWVELAFAYGSPNKPFIRSIVPHNLTLPKVERNEQRWQHNPESYMRIDKDGNQERVTDLEIHDQSLDRLIEAMENNEQYHRSAKETQTDDTETIGALKLIKAFGAMQLLSGGAFDVAAIDHLRLTTKANAIIKVLGNIQQNVTGDVVSEAGSKHHFEAPKSWIGDDTENALRLMSETAQLVIDLANILATHTHPSTGQITQSAAVSSIATNTASVKTRIDSIAE